MTASMVPPRDDWRTRPFNPDWVSPPGDTLYDWMVDVEPGVQAEAVAVSLGLSVSQFADLLAGELEISDDLAGRLAEQTGTSKTFWLNREDDYRRRPRRSEGAGGEPQ